MLLYGKGLTEDANSYYRDRREQEIVVAVIDTGINIQEGVDISRVILTGDECFDEVGHGTQIVSLIQNNTSENVSILPVKVVGEDGTTSMRSVCEGIRNAVENGADIINLSMNAVFYTEGNELETLINELYKKDIRVIVSAGNAGEDTKFLTPANIEKAIVVSAMTDEKEPYYFSNYGRSVDISALGIYNGALGTSFAAAYVTSYCAQLLADGCEDVETELYKKISRITQKEYGAGYLEWKGQYIGEKSTVSEVYVGKTKRTLNEKALDILEWNWKTLTLTELDAVIGKTDYKYIGLFLSKMSEAELAQIKKVSHILNTTVGEMDAVYDKEHSEYLCKTKTEMDYISYCLKEYEEERDKMFLTSDWDCRTTEAVFYLSSFDRKTIYRYSLTGLYGHAWVIGSVWKEAFTDSDLSITYSEYKSNGATDSFTQPIPTRISTFIPSVRATRVDAYKEDDTFLWTGYSWNYIGENCDDACPYVGISIVFNNYTNKKTGYHNSENAISMYNAELGIGTSVEPALSYNYLNAHYGGELTALERNFVNFSTTERGYVKYWYEGVFKDGYDVYNATTVEESLESYRTGSRVGIYLSTGKTSINDETGTFTLNIVPPIGLGTQWYGTYDNKLWADSDIPEVVFNLLPNNYRVVFDGNGAQGGNTAVMRMVYDREETLHVNGFFKTGFLFTGWNTEKDGSGMYYADGQKVKNLISENNVTLKLYAQWKPITYIIRFHNNDGVGIMSNMAAVYDMPVKLRKNTFTRNNGYGPSEFKGWNIDDDSYSELYSDEEVVINLSDKENDVIDLYAIWDDCPWIIADDLYYSLEDAQNGKITYVELVSHAVAKDREAGGFISPGTDAQKGTAFFLVDYAEDKYSKLQGEDNTEETYRVIDSGGNEYQKTIIVHIVDTTPVRKEPMGITRFINEKYYYESYENGGLMDSSIWKVNPDYVKAIQDSFENSKNDTPMLRFYFTYEEILKMKEFVKENGVGNSRKEDALKRFYDEFILPNVVM